VASPTGEFSIQATLSQFTKRDNSDDQKHDSDNISSGEILSIVIAALTLLVGIIALLRSQFRRWVSSISSAIRVYPPFLALPKPVHLQILNLRILHRELSASSPRPLRFQPQRTQARTQFLCFTLPAFAQFLCLALATFTKLVPMPRLLAPVLTLSCVAKMASAGKMIECRK